MEPQGATSRALRRTPRSPKGSQRNPKEPQGTPQEPQGTPKEPQRIPRHPVFCFLFLLVCFIRSSAALLGEASDSLFFAILFFYLLLKCFLALKTNAFAPFLDSHTCPLGGVIYVAAACRLLHKCLAFFSDCCKQIACYAHSDHPFRGKSMHVNTLSM
jgi:hypothetical protein